MEQEARTLLCYSGVHHFCYLVGCKATMLCSSPEQCNTQSSRPTNSMGCKAVMPFTYMPEGDRHGMVPYLPPAHDLQGVLLFKFIEFASHTERTGIGAVQRGMVSSTWVPVESNCKLYPSLFRACAM